MALERGRDVTVARARRLRTVEVREPHVPDWEVQPEQTAEGLRAINNIPRGTGLPRVPEELIEQIINRDTFALLGLR